MDAQKTATVASGRTVPMNGDAVRRLRIQKGWTVEQFADKAICSVKTIQSVEHGKSVYLATLVKIAARLDVPKETLIQGYAPKPEPMAPEKNVPSSEAPLGGCMMLLIPFNQFDEAVDLPELCQKLADRFGLKGELIISFVKPGNSVAIDFQLTDAEDARLLVRAFLNHSLEELRVFQLTIEVGKGLNFPRVVAEELCSFGVEGTGDEVPGLISAIEQNLTKDFAGEYQEQRISPFTGRHYWLVIEYLQNPQRWHFKFEGVAVATSVEIEGEETLPIREEAPPPSKAPDAREHVTPRTDTGSKT